MGGAILTGSCPSLRAVPHGSVFVIACVRQWLLTNPEPVDMGGARGVRSGLDQGRRSRPFWGSSLPAGWLAAPCLEQQRLLEAGSTVHNGTKDVIT